MPNYVVLEETKGDELRVEVGRRAMRLEERNSRRDGIKMHYEFIKDMSRREHDKKKEIESIVERVLLKKSVTQRNGMENRERKREREGGK